MNNQAFLNQWFEAQKKMAEQWQAMIPGSAESVAGIQKIIDAQQKMINDWTQAFKPVNTMNTTNPFAMYAPMMNMSNILESQKEMWQTMQNMYQDSPMAAYIKQFPDLNTSMENFRNLYDPTAFFKMLDSDSYKTFTKMMDANQNFVAFYNYFDKLRVANSQPFVDDAKKIMEKWVTDNKAFYQDFVAPFIPPQIREVLNTPQNLVQTLQDSMAHFVTPWAESFFDLVKLYVEGANGDADKLAEFFNLWKEKYNQTVAPLFKMPGMGNNTEKIESQSALIDNSIQLILSAVEFQQKLSQVSQNRVKELIGEYEELIKNGEQPQSYKEFYKYWTGEIEKTLKDYFYTDEFTEMLAGFGKAYSRFISARNHVIEIALRGTPIVVESDARSLYKKVHDLKRDVNILKRQLRELQAAEVNGEGNEKKATTRRTTRSTTKKDA